MNTLKFLAIVLICLFPFCAKTQGLAFYTDYKNYGFAFDKGTIMEVEYLPVTSFQVGGTAVAYIDNTSSLKVVQNGKVIKLSEGFITKYTATDYLVSYSIMQLLNVYDNGKKLRLSSYTEYYSTSDSLVAFYDVNTRVQANAFKVYYRGEIITIEEAISDIPVKEYKLGDNILAYINYLNQFKLYYRGKIIDVMTLNRSFPYEAGKNIVAYFDDTFNFKVFFKGDTYSLDVFQPKSFAAGDDMVAYVANDAQLKVFFNGKTTMVCPFEPRFYKVKDSLLVYNEANFFKAFYNGKIYTIENYMPENFHVDYNTIAYLDQQGRLKTFYHGKTEFITKRPVDQFMQYRDVITYKISNTNYTYYKSKVY